MDNRETKLLGEVIALAADLHKDDIYDEGRPYVFHLLQVLKSAQEQGESFAVQVLSMLHDSFEDHPEGAGRVIAFLEKAFPGKLQRIPAGMPGESVLIASSHSFLDANSDRDHVQVFDSLKALSRHYFGQETYNEFLDRVIKDEDATVVKLLDLQRNSSQPNKSEKNIRRTLERYIPAMQKVTKALLSHRTRY